MHVLRIKNYQAVKSRAVITLVEKKGKCRTLLENWRSVSVKCRYKVNVQIISEKRVGRKGLLETEKAVQKITETRKNRNKFRLKPKTKNSLH